MRDSSDVYPSSLKSRIRLLTRQNVQNHVLWLLTFFKEFVAGSWRSGCDGRYALALERFTFRPRAFCFFEEMIILGLSQSYEVYLSEGIIAPFRVRH